MIIHWPYARMTDLNSLILGNYPGLAQDTDDVTFAYLLNVGIGSYCTSAFVGFKVAVTRLLHNLLNFILP